VEFETRAIHAGQEPDALTGSVNVPIYQTSTYAQDGVLQMRGGHDYARTINPTRTALEQCLASLEGGAHGVCFSSGMGATTAIMELFSPGSRTVAINDVYGGTYRLFSKLYARKGYDYEYLDLTDESTARQAFERPADLVWLETPSNPLLKIVDIAAIAERAHAAGAVVVVDNTFASPYLQQPLALGADIVVHSTTKYIGGHSDAVGGAAITNHEETAERLHFVQNSMGAVPGPVDCFLTLRGAKTLAVRMERHCDNAELIARWLTESPAVSHVYYPGLAAHPGHETARRQMRRFGGMIAFQVRGGRAAVDAALTETGVWTLGESLGGVESLIEHPGAMTHASLAGSGFEVPDDLIRLSVGIEHADDLLHDLVQMLAHATQSRSRPIPVSPAPETGAKNSK
jgi:cystathionine gamma-synthase